MGHGLVYCLHNWGNLTESRPLPLIHSPSISLTYRSVSPVRIDSYPRPTHMKNSRRLLLQLLLLSTLLFPGCHDKAEHSTEHDGEHAEHEHPRHKIVVTRPVAMDVVSTEQFVSRIHSRRHIEIRALEGGYLEEVKVNEGQSVTKGDLMFKILPVLYKARLDSEMAEAELARLKVENTRQLVNDKVVSERELALAEAEYAKVKAKVQLAEAELNFTDVRAPFDGIVDRQLHQQGSLIEEGDDLTTLSDNSVIWAYFNVPETRYLEYKARMARGDNDLRIELVLANGETFNQPGEIGAIEADFDNETGNIAFRADFANPEGLLRHGQTGTVLLHRDLRDAIVIPQRATYEILAKQYVYVVDENDVVHQREIVVQKELEDIFVIKEGLDPNDKIVFEGILQVRDGDKVEYEFRDPAEILANLKNHAE